MSITETQSYCIKTIIEETLSAKLNDVNKQKHKVTLNRKLGCLSSNIFYVASNISLES